MSFYRQRFRAGVQAGVQRLGRDEAAQDQGRSADAVRDAAVPAGRQGGGRAGWTQTAEELSAQVHRNIQRSIQLRPRRRPLRGLALLRRDEHEAQWRRPAQGAADRRLRPLPGHRHLDRDVPDQPGRQPDWSVLQESASLKAASSSPPASSCSSSSNVEESWLPMVERAALIAVTAATAPLTPEASSTALLIAEGSGQPRRRAGRVTPSPARRRRCRAAEAPHVVDEVARCAQRRRRRSSGSPRSGFRP